MGSSTSKPRKGHEKPKHLPKVGTPENLEWTINGYFRSFAALILLGGKLGDRFRRKKIFLVGLAIFTLCSAACALSTSDAGLNSARAVQGVGAALSPALQKLLAIKKAGLLEPYILITTPDNALAGDYPAYRDTHREKLHQYITDFIIQSPNDKKPADNK